MLKQIFLAQHKHVIDVNKKYVLAINYYTEKYLSFDHRAMKEKFT